MDDVTRLWELGACRESVSWLRRSGLSMAEAWRVCKRGDWLLWYAVRVVDRRAVVRACCDVARGVLHLVPAGEEQPRLAIEAAERWAEEPTAANRNAAWDAALAARDAALASGSYAARTAALAACEAAMTAANNTGRVVPWSVANNAAHAEAWAVNDADNSASPAAMKASLKRSADVVRRHFPEVPEMAKERR